MTRGELSLPRLMLIALGGAVIPLTCHAGGPAAEPVRDLDARSERTRAAERAREAAVARERAARRSSSSLSASAPRRDAQPAPRPNRVLPPATTPEPRPSSPRDAELATLQRMAVAVARAELERGVVESPLGSNRAPRIDRYARVAGMSPGQAWCGHFLAYCYTAAARRAGRSFLGQKRLHSVGKTRSYFNYRVYTQRSTPRAVAAWEALRREQTARGPARRYLTLRGSHGDRWARRARWQHEVFADLRALPVRPGDAVIFVRAAQGTKLDGARGHLGLVESYADGILTTLEGNTGHRVRRKRYDLRRQATRARIDGFGRPALADFQR